MESANDFGVNITDPMLQNVPDANWDDCVAQPQRAPGNGIQQAMMTLQNRVAWATMVRNKLKLGEHGECFLEPQDKAYAARLVSACQRGVRSAFQAIPSQHDLVIPNEALAYHIRVLLNDPKLAKEEARLAEKCCPTHPVSEHTRTCVKGGGMFARHASICRVLKTCLTKLANVDVVYSVYSVTIRARGVFLDWGDSSQNNRRKRGNEVSFLIYFVGRCPAHVGTLVNHDL